MLDALYRRRLERDLDRWVRNGWVEAPGAESIRASLGGDLGVRTAAVFAFLGAALMAAAAIAFVAANWAEIPRPVRLAVLGAGMAICYGLAAWLHGRRMPWFSDAAVFLGAVLYGASIVLVAQSYHLSGDYPDALLLWGAGALGAAWLGRSSAALLLALGVFFLWSWYEVMDFGWRVHWPFLIAWAPCAALAARWGWAPGRAMVLAALAGWIGVAVVALAEGADWSFGSAIALLIAIAALFFAGSLLLAGLARQSRFAGFAEPAAIVSLTALLSMLIVLQPALDDGNAGSGAAAPFVVALVLALAAAGLGAGALRFRHVSWMDAAAPGGAALLAVLLARWAEADSLAADGLVLPMALGAIVLAVATWAIAHGQAAGRRTLASIGLVAFAAEILYLYFVTFGTLLDTALFFFIGGLLMIALAVAVMRLQRRVGRSAEAAS